MCAKLSVPFHVGAVFTAWVLPNVRKDQVGSRLVHSWSSSAARTMAWEVGRDAGVTLAGHPGGRLTGERPPTQGMPSATLA